MTFISYVEAFVLLIPDLFPVRPISRLIPDLALAVTWVPK